MRVYSSGAGLTFDVVESEDTQPVILGAEYDQYMSVL